MNGSGSARRDQRAEVEEDAPLTGWAQTAQGLALLRGFMKLCGFMGRIPKLGFARQNETTTKTSQGFHSSSISGKRPELGHHCPLGAGDTIIWAPAKPRRAPQPRGRADRARHASVPPEQVTREGRRHAHTRVCPEGTPRETKPGRVPGLVLALALAQERLRTRTPRGRPVGRLRGAGAGRRGCLCKPFAQDRGGRPGLAHFSPARTPRKNQLYWDWGLGRRGRGGRKTFYLLRLTQPITRFNQP